MRSLQNMFLIGQVGRWQLELLTVFLLLSAGGIITFWLAREKRALIRISVRFVAVILTTSGVLCLLLFSFFFSLFPNPNTYSGPIYSPDRKMAARVWDYNLSGFGGADSSVELFAAHGFRTRVVFSGEFQSVDDAQWLDDHSLLVRFHSGPGYRKATCESLAFGVDVICQCSEVRRLSGDAGR
jgi:hypothetical protein